MKTKSSRYIDATKETCDKLAKAFNVVEKSVYLALTYRHDSLTAQKIRHTAVKEYGAKPMLNCAECETLHTVSEKGKDLMVQRFDNGIVLEVEKESGVVRVLNRKGKELLREENVSVLRLMEIQSEYENK